MKTYNFNTEYSSAVQKSLLYLYPIFVVDKNTEDAEMIGQHIFVSVLRSNNLPLLLTYHEKQLIWLLSDGNKIVKLQVLFLWLRSKKWNDGDFLQAITTTRSSELLVEFVLKLKDDAIAKR